jgi:AAA+ superfamily predicted ATPase
MNITNKIRAGYPGIYIVTHEEQRAEAELVRVAKELKFKIQAWSVTHGRFDVTEGTVIAEDEDQLGVLKAIEGLPEKTLIVLKDYHIILNDPNPMIYRLLKDALFHAKTANKCIVILAPVLVLPVDVQKLVAVIDLPLPDRDQLQVVLEGICKGNDKKMPKGDELLGVLDSARGLTTSEAEDAFSLSIVEKGKPDAIVVAAEKSETIRKNGVVELMKTPVTLEDIGGLDVVKTWLTKRRNAFSEEARKYKLPTPKGILVFGIHGTGKSLIAKATAAAFGGIPLLRLDAGAIFAKHVGESEQNMRAVIQVSEAIAPCVLFIDELEKGFQKSGGESDGGTSQRVFGTLLQWMNDKTAPVFVVATSNEVQRLDAALVRKGRFDEIFFVDLPQEDERAEIWNIQIAKYGRDPEMFDKSEHKDLIKLTVGCTGAEIEALWCDSLYTAFEDGREPNVLDVAGQMEDFYPLSKLMAEDVQQLRKWGKGRARPASTVTEQTKSQRKLA